MSKTEEIYLSFVWNGLENAAGCFEHSAVTIHGTAHLADEPHSVRGDNAIAYDLIMMFHILL